jgi:4-oxalocrotonate tautomerase
MPFVTVQITREGATREQKAELIAEITNLLERVLNKNPATTMVVIDEVELDNWGVMGLPALEYRKQRR